MSLTAALLLGTLTQVGANETVDAQISAIQNADGDQRRELMNAFKRELSQMNEQERSEAIAKMREQLMTQEQAREHTRTMSENGQADQMNNRYQQQNQMNNMIQSTTQQSGGMPKK